MKKRIRRATEEKEEDKKMGANEIEKKSKTMHSDIVTVAHSRHAADFFRVELNEKQKKNKIKRVNRWPH